MRDDAGEIIERTNVATDGAVTVTKYTGAGLILDATGSALERVLPLPCGALLTQRPADSAAHAWPYPNTHGDIVITADGTGTTT